jgi:HAD superfamily hydrolase (TIGR01509 family)
MQTAVPRRLERRRESRSGSGRSAGAPVTVRDRRGGPAAAEPPVSVETLSTRWSSALSAARAAIASASIYLPPDELRELQTRLDAERDPTTRLLQAYAQNEHQTTRYLRLVIAPQDARRLLGVRPGVAACVFNLDGVLIGSSVLHVAAWTQTFDELISRRVERARGRFEFAPAPFNPRTDYPEHIHGRPRLEGIRNFLASRGLTLPEGRPDDPPGAETVHGLANRKNELVTRLIEERRLTAYEGSRRYLELVRDAGMSSAILSASAHATRMLERAGLSELITARVDGNTIVAEHLQARPATDIPLAACRLLGVEPRHAAVFETSPAGVAAGRAAGFDLVVGVDHDGRRDVLLERGADVVVSGLAELLERALPE